MTDSPPTLGVRRFRPARWVLAALLLGTMVAMIAMVFSRVMSPVASEATTTIPAEARPATVDYVHDGDTLFLLLDGERLKVRLIGIDTPEVGEHAECYGEEATAALRALLPEGSTVHALTDGCTHDQYDRSLFYLFRDDAALVNVELVASGAATTLLISDNDRYWPELEAAEQAARAAGLGLWGAC